MLNPLHGGWFVATLNSNEQPVVKMVCSYKNNISTLAKEIPFNTLKIVIQINTK